jgi:isoleucyl-tRNA synthetase
VANAVEANSLDRLGHQVLEELNVKRLEMLPVESDMLLYALKPRMNVLGPKFGKLAPKVAAAVRSVDAQEAARVLRETGTLKLEVEGEETFLTPEEVEIEASAREGYVAAEDRGYVAVLETTLTPELEAEGLMRDLTHLIQDVRKHAGLAIEDSIDTSVATDAELAATVERFADYVKDETLTKRLTVLASDTNGAAPKGSYAETIPAAKLGGHEAQVTVKKRA